VKSVFITAIIAAGLAGCASGGSGNVAAQDDENSESKASVRTVCRKERTSGGSTGSRVSVERVCEQVIEPAGE
jgi:hypothetical protein